MEPPGSVEPEPDPEPEPEDSPPLGTTCWAEPEPVMVTEWLFEIATPVATSAAAATPAVTPSAMR